MIAGNLQKICSLAKFRWFERSINSGTRANHSEMLRWAFDIAEEEKRSHSRESVDISFEPVVAQGLVLANNARRAYEGKYSANSEGLRVLIHLPPSEHSAGGYSLFRNLAQSLSFIGIPTQCFAWRESIEDHLRVFAPTVLISSDASSYLNRIHWGAVDEYRKSNTLKLGLTASLEEYGNTPLSERLKWAEKHGVNFYYSFKAPEYLITRGEYRPYFEAGYKILSVEFGANPLLYHPVAGIKKDLDFVFLASSNGDKRQRYYSYLNNIFRCNVGLIDGPGWSGIKLFAPPDIHRFLYARAKVGINLHIDNSLDWPSELNERTYILAACGVPQLIDDAKLLPYRFSHDAMFVAKTPDEYTALFHEIIARPDLAQKRAMKALREVFEKHTTFHRAEKFALDLQKLVLSR